MRVSLAAQVASNYYVLAVVYCYMASVNLLLQVMSSTVADALTYEDNDDTTETRLFIRLFDEFFDCLNVKSVLEGTLKRKPARLPYHTPNDQRFKVHIHINILLYVCVVMCHMEQCKHVYLFDMQWLKEVFLKYLDDWENEVSLLTGISEKEKTTRFLSKETNEGLHIAGDLAYKTEGR